MIGGAHFRSDVYAGLLLGAAMITVFYQNPQFTGALADASVDLRWGAARIIETPG
jgi:hypothetical protein